MQCVVGCSTCSEVRLVLFLSCSSSAAADADAVVGNSRV